MIYLDNAATSWPKPDIMCSRMMKFLTESCANPGRGGHEMSRKSGMEVLNVRESIAHLFGIENPLQIAFMQNATQALNTAIYGILCKGDHAIATSMDHNSVLRPLKTLEKYEKIELTIVQADSTGEIDVEKVQNAIRPNTRLIVCTMSSNVTGTYLPYNEIGKIASSNGIIFLLDSSQGAGHSKINVNKDNIDLLAFPGHKCLMGPQGTGGLYVAEHIKLNPIMQGGTGSNSELTFQPEMMPDLLESGTLNTPGIIGLGASVDFIKRAGLFNIQRKKVNLLQGCIINLCNIKKIKLYSTNNNNSGIIAFNIEGMDSTEVSYILDKKYHIATRAGLHCAPLAHKSLGTTKTGIVRISPGFFNTQSDMDLTAKAIYKIASGSVSI